MRIPRGLAARLARYDWRAGRGRRVDSAKSQTAPLSLAPRKETQILVS